MKPSHSIKKNIVLGSLGMLWLVIVLIGYYYTHKPFTPEVLVGLLIASWRILIVLGIVSLSGGIGFKILKGRAGQVLSQSITQAALGLGILSVITLIIGATCGLYWWLFGSVMIFSGFLLRKSTVEWWNSWVVLKEDWRKSGNFGKTIAILLIFILTCSFIISLAPPLEFDAMTYHLAIPRAYLYESHISFLPNNVLWGMPEGTEMLNTLVMVLGGNETASLLGWFLGLLTIMGIFSYAKERLGNNAAWVAITCLLVGETFSSSLAWGYNEWPSMFFATATLITLDEWLKNKASKTAVLAGIFGGMALTTKYTAGLILLAGMIIILNEFKMKNWQTTFKTLLIFGISAVLVFSPWLIKNTLPTGNPLYPILYPSGEMDELRLDFYQKNSVTQSWFETLLLPWQATVWGIEGKVGYSSSIGPLLLGLSLMAGFGWQNRARIEKIAIRNVGLLTVTGLVIWGIASRIAEPLYQSRLFFSFFPAWAILGGAGFDSISKIKVATIRFGRIASSLILLVLVFAVLETGLRTQRQGALDVLLGLQNSEEYKADNMGWYAPAMEAIRRLPNGTRVLLLWEPRSLYCLPKCDPDEIIDRWYHDIRTYGTADKVLTSWREQGYTHLLINLDGAKFIRENETWDTDQDWDYLETLLNSLNSPNEFGNSYSLYSLASP